MEYQKKSYKLLIIYAILFVFLIIAGGYGLNLFLPNLDKSIFIKIELMLIDIWLLTLFYIMYKKESIYWINGITYNEAKNMTSEHRKKYALDHLIVFLKATIISFVYCIISYILDFSSLIDIVVLALIIIIAAIKTIPIKA